MPAIRTAGVTRNSVGYRGDFRTAKPSSVEVGCRASIHGKVCLVSDCIKRQLLITPHKDSRPVLGVAPKALDQSRRVVDVTASAIEMCFTRVSKIEHGLLE
jgi:hypothetical protein